MIVERGVLSRGKQGSESWSQVFIVREGITSWSCLLSMLGAGYVRVYIASTILRGDTFGLQDI